MLGSPVTVQGGNCSQLSSRMILPKGVSERGVLTFSGHFLYARHDPRHFHFFTLSLLISQLFYKIGVMTIPSQRMVRVRKESEKLGNSSNIIQKTGVVGRSHIYANAKLLVIL